MDRLLDRLVVAVGTHYLVEGELGRGGMAVVYRALDLRLNRHVAIKVLPPELAFNADVRTRFLREAQTAAQLSHPNIVPIYMVDEADGLVFFVMALVHGESLASLLARDPRRPVDEVRRVLHDVADALSYAHSLGVVHRDIKPDNILIDRATGRPTVTDFGIARAAAGDARLTVTGVAVGTPAYMSPEQALGERELDGRSDIYSLGVVGYQMLAGETPFKASNTPAMLVKHVSETPRPMRERRPDIPLPLAAAIDRALAKRPDDRWSSAAAFREAVTSDHVIEPPPPRDDRPREREAARPENPYDRPAQRPSWMPPLPAPPALPPLSSGPPSIPRPGPGASRADWNRWKQEQREEWRNWRREHSGELVRFAHARYAFDERPLEERVMSFRRSVLSFLILSPILLFINAATGGPPWFVIPAIVFAGGVLRRASSLWADGIGPIDAFRKGIRKRLRAERGDEQAALPAAVPAPRVDPVTRIATPEVLAGAYGDVVRRASNDREVARDVLARLGPVERELIPDVQPTVDALTERIAGLASTLHRLDADVSGTSLGQLDERIASLEREAHTADGDRRLSLLQRQRASLHDLLSRRQTLVAQLESASLALQNLKLDLLKLRSAGVDAALGDVTSATQEARALSRDIGHVLDAAEDVRKL